MTNSPIDSASLAADRDNPFAVGSTVASSSVIAAMKPEIETRVVAEEPPVARG